MQAYNHTIPLRVLIIEDNQDDTMILVDVLEEGGYSVHWQQVENETQMLAALEHPWDIVFSDFTMPGFSGSRALDILREKDPDIPFVFVSGTLGEEAAVQAMKAGAQDYVIKGQLVRVLPTVERELRDVEQRRERRQIDAARERLIAILEATPDMVVILGPDGDLHYLNKAGRKFLDVELDEDVRSFYLSDMFPESLAEQVVLNIMPEVKQNGVWSGESTIQVGDREVPVSLVMLGHYGEDGYVEYFSAIARDISERKRFEEEMEHAATHDGLTDLPNRLLLMDRFNSALKHAVRAGTFVAVMFIDLDNFKRVNDTLGHYAGDMLLRITARRIKKVLRPTDTVSRHGGDEFSIIITDLESVENAITTLRKIKAEFERPVIVYNNEVYVTFSTGIALYPHDGESVEDLLRHADTAMYRAKSSGPGQYRFYAPAMNARGHEMLALEAELRRALEKQEFLLHYQPQVDLRSGNVVGVEGLMRWQHPTRGLVSPLDFIPLLESSGLIIPAGEWVLREACKACRDWIKKGLNDIRVSINVSALQFNDPDFLEKVHTIIREEQVPPDRLELEITENIVMQDPEGTCEILQALHDLGVRIAVDDFGTGYSSLAYLKRFPIDILKIDRTFIHDLGKDDSDDAIVEASISMAQKLGLETIAEGVETAQQLDFLRMRGCDLVQGYYLSRPLSGDAIEALLDKNRRWSL